MAAKEEHAVILDFLPNGYPMDTRPLHLKTAIAQAIGKSTLVLLELVPKKDIFLQPNEEVYIGEGKRDKIHHIIGRISPNKLTETAKTELNFVIEEIVTKEQGRFVEFFNKAGSLNTRMHQLELLPGIGKRHMLAIMEARDEKPFTSFEDIKQRVKLLPDPEKAIMRRILLELEGTEKHYLFVRI
jgi:putative nucleotide binding protein